MGTKISALTDGTGLSLTGAELWAGVQAGATYRFTAQQISAFAFGHMSGDATASGTGALTLATVNSNVGAFGSATAVPVITINGKGLVTAVSTTPLTSVNGVSYPASFTSGGVPYASGTGAISSSAALAAGSLVVGGGAGTAPSTIAGASATLTSYPIFTLASTSNTAGPQDIRRNDVNDSTSALYISQKSRSNADVVNGDFIFNFIGEPWANTAYRNAFQMNFRVSGAPSGSHVPTKVEFLTSSATVDLGQSMTFDDLGALTLSTGGVLKIASSQVVAARVTGYAAMTGTPDKASTFATASVTLAQLAGRVMQLQADLTTHGLIGA